MAFFIAKTSPYFKEARMSRGNRESNWLVMRRCLAILCRTQRGPATWEELVQAVLTQEGADAYGETEGQTLRRRLENDLQRIRDQLYVDLYFDRRAGGYVIRDIWRPLLDLPDEDLATIAWLEQIFGHDAPQHDEVHDLLGRLRLYLALERRREVERHRTALVVDLGQRDEDEIAPGVWEGLADALTTRRRIEFSYCSPQREDETPLRHVVDPYERYFDTVRGHYYLRGWCHYFEDSSGQHEQCRYHDYRLGRISDLQVLPHKLPPTPPPAPRYTVVYELAPQVARQGITRQPHIEIKEIERREDGSAVVRGTTESVFWAIQALMHYRYNCRVLGGPEMLREMRKTVQKMAEIYAEDV
jgi:predicted DNA-binding transcriptional regulator YafY